MSKVFITRTVDGLAAVDDATWEKIQAEAATHRRSRVIVESYSEDAEWSDQQRKWWKGVLLPALAKDTGDSEAYWEAVLKLVVMPDEFQFITVVVDGTKFTYLPSITELGIGKMNLMIKGSVAHLRDETIYGTKLVDGKEVPVFDWVTEPRKELRT